MQSSISLRADISQLRSELAKVPGITEAEAQRMVIALEKNFKKAETAAKALSKSQAREAEKAAKAAEKAAADQARAYERSLDDIKRGSEKVFGGIVGDIEDVGKGLVSLGGSAGGLAAALGGAGLAFGVVVAGAGAAVYATHEFIAGAIEARDRLEEFAGVEPVPESALAALADYERAMTAASVASDRLYVMVAGQLTTALGDLPYVIIGIVDRLGDLAEYMASAEKTAAALGTTFRLVNAVMTMGRSETIAYGFEQAKFAEIGKDVASTLVVMTDEQEEQTAAVARSTGATRTAADAKRDQAAAEREAAAAIRDAVKAAEAQMAAQTMLRGMVSEALAFEITQVEAINAKYDERIIKIMDQGAAAGDAALAQEALAANEIARVHELDQAKAQADAAEKARNDAIDAQNKAAHDKEMARIRAERDANIDALASVTQSMVGLFAYQTDAEWQALQERENISKKELIDGWKRYKSAKRTEAIISAAAGALAIVPSMAYLGPGAFAAAAVAAGAGLAVQLATIGAQKPPEFPTGGYAMDRAGTSPRQSSADHVVVGVRPDERILSPQESRMYDGGAQPVYLMLDRRVVAEAMVSAGGTARLAPPAGRVSGRATAYGRG